MSEKASSQEINLTLADNAVLEGVAIGDRNKIISHVQAQGNVVQADHSQVHIGDIYYYFEIPTSDVIKKEPYKFLSTYTLADADIFFGRKQAIADLSAQILDHKLVIINGKSGSGKSSLMYAGVTPKLLRNNQLVIHITDYRDTPVTTIQEAIQGDLESPLVIFLDQFERFFIYLPLSDQQHFTNALQGWLANDTANVRFVIAIRMDFFGRLGEFQPVIPNLYQESAIFTLLPLNRDEAKEAIEGPLEVLNIRIVYEPELLDTLLDSLLEESEIEPAQLQIVCDELYRRTLASNAKIINAALYEAAGGVKGMLENYLQRKLAEYTPDDDEVKAILKQMIAPVEVSAGIRTFVAVAQIGERIKLPQQDIERLITRLVDDRLIEKKSGEETYSIAHEYLAGQVQQWFDPRETAIRRARDILDHAVRYETLMPYQEASQVKEYAADLELNDTEHALLQRSLRKHTLGVWLRWGIVTVITLLAIIATVAGFYANLQRQEAERRLFISTAQSLVFRAMEQTQNGDREHAALLTRQAYFLNLDSEGKINDQIDATLRLILLTQEGTLYARIEQICQQASRNLTLVEWQEFAGTNIPYTPCPDLADSKRRARFVLRLRDQPIITHSNDPQTLSLNLNATGVLKTKIDKAYESCGSEVVVDYATNLMWQKSDSAKPLTYSEARTNVETLNRKIFAGYDDWRLPTIEELLSLLEPVVQLLNDSYVNPIFDTHLKAVWSADIYDENVVDSAWFIDFYNGKVAGYGQFDDTPIGLRAVRSVREIDPITEANTCRILEEGQNLAKKGNIDSAVANFKNVIEVDPGLKFDPTTEAHKWRAQGLVEEGQDLASKGKIDSALANFNNARALDSGVKVDLYELAAQLAQAGNVKDALAVYAEARKLDLTPNIFIEYWIAICWYGSLNGGAAEVLDACEQAVNVAKSETDKAISHDSRGLARALTGNFAGAIEDFQVYVDKLTRRVQESHDSKDIETWETKKVQRQQWIEVLQKEENPFTPEVVEQLREQY